MVIQPILGKFRSRHPRPTLLLAAMEHILPALPTRKALGRFCHILCIQFSYGFECACSGWEYTTIQIPPRITRKARVHLVFRVSHATVSLLNFGEVKHPCIQRRRISINRNRFRILLWLLVSHWFFLSLQTSFSHQSVRHYSTFSFFVSFFTLNSRHMLSFFSLRCAGVLSSVSLLIFFSLFVCVLWDKRMKKQRLCALKKNNTTKEL